MTARREWFANTNFLIIRFEVVEELSGSYEAAAVLDRIHFRSGGEGWWRVTKDAMAADVHLTEWKLRSALELLREKGLIEWRRASANDATNEYRVVFEQVDESIRVEVEESSGSEVEESSVSSTKKEEELTTTTPPTHSGERAREEVRGRMTQSWKPSREAVERARAACPHVDLEIATFQFVGWIEANRPDDVKSQSQWDGAWAAWVGQREEKHIDSHRESEEKFDPVTGWPINPKEPVYVAREEGSK